MAVLHTPALAPSLSSRAAGKARAPSTSLEVALVVPQSLISDGPDHDFGCHQPPPAFHMQPAPAGLGFASSRETWPRRIIPIP